MSWAKFDDKYPDHPKIVEVGPLGMALHIAATCYCARYLTDGFIPDAMITRLINFEGINTVSNGVSNAVTNKDVTNRLVAAGLLEVVPGGYQIHDYLEYNPSSTQMKAEKAENARRQAEWREKNRGIDGKFVSNGVSNGVTNASYNTAPYPYPLNLTTTTRENTETIETEPRPELFSIYEKEIGILTPMIAEALMDAEKEYPTEWFQAAFREAAGNNKRNWKYAQAILKRWKIEGFQSQRKPVQNFRPKTSRVVPARQEPKYTPEQLLASLEAAE